MDISGLVRNLGRDFGYIPCRNSGVVHIFDDLGAGSGAGFGRGVDNPDGYNGIAAGLEGFQFGAGRCGAEVDESHDQLEQASSVGQQATHVEDYFG